MNFEQKQKEILQKAILTYGNHAQLNQVMEECAELIKECSKAIRGKKNRPCIIEEVADVYIMLTQLRMMFEIDGVELKQLFDYKIRRLGERLDELESEVKNDGKNQAA